jgi:arabinose-5-phosphate isomerase
MRGVAVTVFDEAIQALQSARDRLGDPFDAAVSTLLACSRNAVCTGMGKSGIVARKLAATLSSTGTSAVFLHPADACHGDLGMVRRGDVLVVLSNSGETAEVLAILPAVRRIGAGVLAITGQPRSSLARLADVNLDASTRDAGPHGLAPTTSTTVAQVLGDALAMTLMDRRGFRPQDFAALHPTGALGKRLLLKVSDVMHTGASLPSLDGGAAMSTVIEEMSSKGMGAVLIRGADGLLIGIVTDGDLRRALRRLGKDLLDGCAADIMTPRPLVVRDDARAADCVALMEDRPSQISVLPVVDAQGRPAGIVRIHDLVREGLAGR